MTITLPISFRSPNPNRACAAAGDLNPLKFHPHRRSPNFTAGKLSPCSFAARCSLISRPDYIPNLISDPSYVRIFDTTLRDGEQSPGATMTSGEKIAVARQLSRLGVDIIEAGFPASSPDDLEAVRSIAMEVGNREGEDGHLPVICGLARCSEKDIDAAWEAVRHARRPRVHTFIATSEIHMQHKLRKTREEVVRIAREMLGYARKLGCEDVEFSPEDAGRPYIFVYIFLQLVFHLYHLPNIMRFLIHGSMICTNIYLKTVFPRAPQSLTTWPVSIYARTKPQDLVIQQQSLRKNASCEPSSDETIKSNQNIQRERHGKLDGGGLKNKVADDVLELSIAASEAVVISEMMSSSMQFESFSDSAIIEIALRVKHARNECTLETAHAFSASDPDDIDQLSDLDENSMSDAFEDVGITVQQVAETS